MFSVTSMTNLSEFSLPSVNQSCLKAVTEDKCFLNIMKRKQTVDYSSIKSIHGKGEILFPLPGKINCLYVSITHITLALSH